MSCVLYTDNTSNALLADNAQVPFGSVVHRKGRAVTLEGNEIAIRGGCNSYAKVSGVLNLAVTAQGEEVVTLYVDGVAVEAITVTVAAGGDYVAIPFALVVKGNYCGVHRLTVRISAGGTLASFPVEVETVD